MDCCLTMIEIEEHFQAGFKKLRIDAEGSTASLSMIEGLSPRMLRNTEEAKIKHVCTNKDSWHWCLRKPLRGMIQQRGRSKSPVLHPAKFIHYSIKMPSCNQPVETSPGNTSESGPGWNMPVTVELSKNEQVSQPLNGADQKVTRAQHSGTLTMEIPQNQPENGPAAISLPIALLKAADFLDFQSVSEKNKVTLCASKDKTRQCKQWQDMKMCMPDSAQSAPERRAHEQDNLQSFLSRTSSSSLKSHAKQARASVDDVTIEDLSGYMEYFLHIPKEMSHMAEMMYN